MTSDLPHLPPRLLCCSEGAFEVVNTRDLEPDVEFDIISYTWGELVPSYNCGIPGVSWNLRIPPRKIEDIMRLMIHDNINYLWVDCVCLHQEDEREKAVELLNMYNYYKDARKCYILMDMDKLWLPQDIVKNLKFIDHVLSHMEGTAVTSESRLTTRIVQDLSEWATREWAFPVDSSIARAAAIDMGVLNCYSTCVGQVKSIFRNTYFTRVWTFQEMLLGKNITMFGINNEGISCIGQLQNWMDLATDCKDKAYKLLEWIEKSRKETPTSVQAILRIVSDDYWALSFLQIQVRGIDCAKNDILVGGPSWWHENHKGVSNVFSAICITARKSKERGDLFRGLLGIFSGLFTPTEAATELMGDNIERISFVFFKKLSTVTKFAWTKLAASSSDRGEWDWIPMVANHGRTLMTTDCFSGVVKLGKLAKNGQATARAVTGITGFPQQYMTIQLRRADANRFGFIFHGCNCGKETERGFYRTAEQIPPKNELPKRVVGDETGRILVQCATILGSIMDPANDVVEYRKRLLGKLRPEWRVSDPSAKTTDWIDRCVSGTDWETPDPRFFKVHNRSVNYEMGAITGCESRLHNESTANITCTVNINCGCKIVGPFSLIFNAITAVAGSSLGGTSATLEKTTGRIVLCDGLGLVQVGDVDRLFSLVAFLGDVTSHLTHAKECRRAKLNESVNHNHAWPQSRALLRQGAHDLSGLMRDYGCVDTKGSGQLLIFKKNFDRQYKIVGACVDGHMTNMGKERDVAIH